MNSSCAASFTKNATEVCSNGWVQFTDTSAGSPTTWLWQFGDGTANPTSQNISHQFTTPGTYYINVTATNGCGSNLSSNQTITVNPTCTANFTSNITSICPNGWIQFNDTSTGSPTSWNWQWGDGRSNSTDRNATHQYTTAGTYSVNLTAGNTCGDNTIYNAAYITVNPSCVADFTSNITDTCQNSWIQFNDTSSGSPISWNWQWGDGTANSTARNVTHQYTDPGTYSVNLTASNGCGGNTTVKAAYVTINPLAVVNFTQTATNGTDPLTVQFNDTSTGSPTSWTWQFNNTAGNQTWTTFSTLQNATYPFPIGNYTIRLTATNGCGSNTSTRVSWVNVTRGVNAPIANFTSNVTSGCLPVSVQFNDTSTNTPTSWNWSFGDTQWFNTTDPASKDATHVYSSTGAYEVKLHVQNDAGEDWENKTSYITVGSTCVANFASNVTSICPGGWIQFTDTSTGSSTSWIWQWGDGTANTTDQSPKHQFTTAGTYQVDLTVTNGCGGSVTANQTITVNPTCASRTAYIRVSGGGASPLNEFSEVYTQHVKIGEPYTASFGQDALVQKIIFTFKENLDDLFIRMEWMDSIPPTMSTPPGKVYQYFKITSVPVSNTFLDSATIYFSVNKNWQEKNEYSQTEINLVGYHENGWETLPTEFLSETGTERYYQGRIDRWDHYFAINGKKNEPAVTPSIQTSNPPFSQTSNATISAETNIPYLTADFIVFGLFAVVSIYITFRYFRKKEMER